MPTALRRALVLLVSLTLPLPLTAQRVLGTVLRPDSTTPAPQVLVEWRVGRGAPQRVLTDSRGRFAIVLSAPDSVTLRVLRPGFRAQQWPALFVGATATLEPRLVLQDQTVVLATVRVDARGACTGRADGAGVTLFEQVRVAIQSASLAERDPMLRIEAVEYEGEATASGALVVRDSSLRLSPGSVQRRPAALDSIFRFGYVRRTRDTSYYEAPTPDVLADARFANGYCFAMVPADSAPEGLHGVRFVPQRRPGPGIADITGTFWVDRDQLLLRTVEYSYLNVPAHHRANGLGGHLEYAVLPSGHWLLREWVVRMPNLRGGINLFAQGLTVFGVYEDGVTLFADSAGAALAARRPVPGR
ncbi:MAG: carboxypeptidase regulatory-like domain-containing protein [Gemmatimonadaceae bacterium]|nr:carboxypeptidase regulatory-like domain-containing protein [Gemmatimonadaceae bacterium]MCW5826761.1 carboxypeptidase regulatory-like domain-containing protein [Gemmatimonadaceae bacterium]